jgi:hypothetical protein
MKSATNIRDVLKVVCSGDAGAGENLLKTSCLSVVNDRGCLTTFKQFFVLRQVS